MTDWTILHHVKCLLFYTPFSSFFQFICQTPVSGKYVLLQRLQIGLLEVEEIDVIEERDINDGGECVTF